MLNDPTIQTKSYWTIIKSFYNNKKILLILPLLTNDKFVTDKKTKANIFNKFFAQHCTPLKCDSVLQISQHVLTQLGLHSIDFSFAEILKMIRSLNVNKAHDHDDTSISMTSKISKIIAPFHCSIFSVGKVFEKIIFNEMYTFLRNKQLLSPNQSGFRRSDSYRNQFLSITH